eukprot:8230237-Heterocapsa_arctica.AAC.1
MLRSRSCQPEARSQECSAWSSRDRFWWLYWGPGLAPELLGSQLSPALCSQLLLHRRPCHSALAFQLSDHDSARLLGAGLAELGGL